ncbi:MULTISPECIES: YtxH domain-containing protein [Sediminibacillus]|uniref:YtxH domain-containing protein n=1 Tax=Sediminibacillus TaxID=482460 RepID=UPI000409F4F9|nr:YtxH domain-containing protein [Sediminibacillus terrae]
MADSKSILLGFVIGGAVSAAAALLSTPSSGKEIRGQVNARRDDLMDTFKKLKQEGFQLKEQITQTSKEGATMIKDLSADMKSSIESWKNTIEPHQKNIQTYLAQIEDSLKELEEKTQKQKSNQA